MSETPPRPSGRHPLARRDATRLFAAFAALAAVPARARAAADPGTPFSWEGLLTEAGTLARRAYVPPANSPRMAADFEAMGKLTYGDARALEGMVRLFPAARAVAPHAVGLSLVRDGRAHEVTAFSGLFPGGGEADPAGFRVLSPGHASDWLAFLGASYFRAAGSRDQYGLSARGVAVDTALPTPEEFPAFTRFWIECFAPDHVRIHALLDGPSLTGAYGFDCRLTAAGVTQEVRASLFLRRDIERLGLAPITSMFWYDQTGKGPDWRPEVHDSDGLAVLTGTGERIWMPLSNPRASRTDALRADHLRGFGLLQRDQAFDHYQDDGAFYDRRPSLWVEPSASWGKADWGKGAVMLYRMPTAGETQDNLAAFWLSDAPARKGQRRDFAYRLTWSSNVPEAGASARCIDSWQGAAGRPGDAGSSSAARKFVFDFEGPALAGLTRASGVVPVTDLPEGTLVAAAAYPVVGGEAQEAARWRVTLDISPARVPSGQLRLFLQRGRDALSETVIQDLSS